MICVFGSVTYVTGSVTYVSGSVSRVSGSMICVSGPVTYMLLDLECVTGAVTHVTGSRMLLELWPMFLELWPVFLDLWSMFLDLWFVFLWPVVLYRWLLGHCPDGSQNCSTFVLYRPDSVQVQVYRFYQLSGLRSGRGHVAAEGWYFQPCVIASNLVLSTQDTSTRIPAYHVGC